MFRFELSLSLSLWRWMCLACVHMKQLYPLCKCAIKFLVPILNKDYKGKCCALKLLPLDKQLLLTKYFLMQKVVHSKTQQYLKLVKDLMIPSKHLHVHRNKQLFPRKRIDFIFKMGFSFWGCLAWSNLPHHFRDPV